MAFDLLLDQTSNDLVISNGELQFTTKKPDEVRQRLGIRLRTFENEWFIDLSYGIPYMQQIISQARRKDEIDVLLVSEIRDEDGVDGITGYSSTWDRYTREYSFTADILTGNGEVTVAFLNQPATEWVYPDSGDQNSRVECNVTDLQYSANRLYYFINFQGLPANTYATWINNWGLGPENPDGQYIMSAQDIKHGLYGNSNAVLLNFVDDPYILTQAGSSIRTEDDKDISYRSTQ